MSTGRYGSGATASIGSSAARHSVSDLAESAWEIDHIMIGDGQRVNRTRKVSRRKTATCEDTLIDGKLYAANGTRNEATSGKFWSVDPSTVVIEDILTSVAEFRNGYVAYVVRPITDGAKNNRPKYGSEVQDGNLLIPVPQRRCKDAMTTRASSNGIIRKSGDHVRDIMFTWLKNNKGWSVALSGSGSRDQTQLVDQAVCEAVANEDLLQEAQAQVVQDRSSGAWAEVVGKGTRLCVPVSTAIACVIAFRRFGQMVEKENVLQAVLAKYANGAGIVSLAVAVRDLSISQQVSGLLMRKVTESRKTCFTNLLRMSANCQLHLNMHKGVKQRDMKDRDSSGTMNCTCPPWDSINDSEKSGGAFIIRFASKNADHTVAVDVYDALIFDAEEKRPVTLSIFSLAACSGLGWDVDADTLGKHIVEFRVIVDAKWATSRHSS